MILLKYMSIYDIIACGIFLVLTLGAAVLVVRGVIMEIIHPSKNSEMIDDTVDID